MTAAVIEQRDCRVSHIPRATSSRCGRVADEIHAPLYRPGTFCKRCCPCCTGARTPTTIPSGKYEGLLLTELSDGDLAAQAAYFWRTSNHVVARAVEQERFQRKLAAGRPANVMDVLNAHSASVALGEMYKFGPPVLC